MLRTYILVCILVLLFAYLNLYLIIPFIPNKVLNILVVFLLWTGIATLSIFKNVEDFINPFEEIHKSLDSARKWEIYPLPIKKWSILRPVLEAYNSTMNMILTKDKNLANTNHILNEYRHAVDESEIVARIDNDGIITSVNALYLDITKFEEISIVGKKFDFNFSDESKVQLSNQIMNSIKEQKQWSWIIKKKTSEWADYWLKAYIIPIFDNDWNVVENLAVMIDITDIEYAKQKLKESYDNLKELDNKKTEFLNLASHELRTPMTSVRWYCSMILDGDAWEISEEVRLYLWNIYDDATRLVNLINDMLDISKIEAWKFEFNVVEMEVNEFFEKILTDMKMVANEKKVQLKSTVKVPVKDVFYSVPDCLRQAIVNIVWNAIKFTPEQGIVEVEVNIINWDMVIRISDSGIGISKSNFDKIFDKFWQVEDSMHHWSAGTWLWLPIVKSIIEKMWWTITLESEIGKWTTFNLLIPEGKIEEEHNWDSTNKQSEIIQGSDSQVT